ncbi:hypothetical protein [Defluviimonas salinarum]|uniref:DUF892 family protein n=1 Tax=Defluviimonas salinarum TaxID=2992147 RepID=A0ABT3J8J7_9RHOB|nr:hypothetical protein [Defluviimonas salinarum]MCW3783986.1 hypothetical protein [Defluviimonas salinarum]
MTLQARAFPDYAAALLSAYEEEVSGEAYFAALAAMQSGRARDALTLMAEMERATARALEPLLEAADVRPADRSALLEEGRAEAQELAGQSWHDLLTDMRDDYGAYVAEFEVVRAGAPEALRHHADLLVAHEVAIIDHARAELAGDSDSLAPLRRYLAQARSV